MTIITSLPTPPSRADSATFAARGDAFLGALPTFATEVNLVASEVNTNAVAAALSASNAATSASAALTSANYKGPWASLSGALNIPASVSYNDAVWGLVSNIADVSAHTPGVSGQWIRLTAPPSGTVLLATVTPANGVTTCDITGLAPSKMFLVVPQFHQGVGQFELSGVSLVRVRLSIDNGTTWTSDRKVISTNAQYPYVDGFYVYNADTTGAKRLGCFGGSSATSPNYFTDVTVNTGTVNAIRLLVEDGPTFMGVGSFKIYGIN